jgi:hypothetical protein
MLLTLLLAVFLWPGRRRAAGQGDGAGDRKPLFCEEYAAEPAIPVPEKPIPAEEQEKLPDKYGVERLVLMVRDPYWLYAYWEISATRQDEFQTRFGSGSWQSSRATLRLYDVTGVTFNGNNANSFIDIPVSDEVDNWHIHVGTPDRELCLELGRILPDGRFITLLRSNTVYTPRASLSDRLDEEWMWIEGIYRQFGIRRMLGSSPMLVEEFEGGAGIVPLGISSPEFASSLKGENNV